MCSLILLRYQNNNNSAGIEAGIEGAPDSITAGDGDLIDDSVNDNVLDTIVSDTLTGLEDVSNRLEDVSNKLSEIIEKMENDETETGESELNEIKDVLEAISEKEVKLNIDEEIIKVSDEKNEEILAEVEEILFEIRETKNILVENIEVAKEFVGIGFGVMLGIVVGYTIMRFLGR